MHPFTSSAFIKYWRLHSFVLIFQCFRSSKAPRHRQGTEAAPLQPHRRGAALPAPLRSAPRPPLSVRPRCSQVPQPRTPLPAGCSPHLRAGAREEPPAARERCPAGAVAPRARGGGRVRPPRQRRRKTAAPGTGGRQAARARLSPLPAGVCLVAHLADWVPLPGGLGRAPSSCHRRQPEPLLRGTFSDTKKCVSAVPRELSSH